MWKLIIEDDEGKRTVVPLSRDDYTIGRKEGNTIRLTERNISREHARITKKPSSAKEIYLLKDLQSYNGVYVNGLRVAEPIELQHGDLIQIGDYRIVFQDESMTEATAPFMPVTDVEASKRTLPMANAFRGSLLMERPNRLVMLVGPTPGAEYPLDQERMMVGRAEECPISIDHNSVSRLHCEIHALGEGRFEVIDKGSANGVRVNSADLRRGIIEAGDIIELGDVRFKFVGAGQVFVPGANESQQLTAISDRKAEFAEPRRQAKGGSLLPFMLLGAVVAAGLVGGGYVFLSRNGGSSVSADSILEYEQGRLREAKGVCASDPSSPSCDEAHGKANSEIREASSLRGSSEFHDFESMWGEGMLKRVQATTEPGVRRALLQRLEATTSLDAKLRSQATALIQADQDALAPPASAIPAVSVVPSVEPPIPSALLSAIAPPPHLTPSATHAPSIPTPTAAPTPRGPKSADRLKEAMAKNDWVTVKEILYPRKDSLDCEGLRTLKVACKESGAGCANEIGTLRVSKGCN